VASKPACRDGFVTFDALKRTVKAGILSFAERLSIRAPTRYTWGFERSFAVRYSALFGILSALLVASPLALAAEGAAPAPAQPAPAAHAHAHAKFPMKAADYQHAVDGRVQHAREKMEARITRKKLTAEQAREVRGRFDAGVVEVHKVVAEVSADGVVTREEARKVNHTTRALKKAAHTRHHAKA
jgi:hypothetical protein